MKKNLEILLIMPRQEAIDKVNYFYTFSLGIAYISSVLKKAGYHVDCLNMNHFEGSTEQILCPILNKKKYDFVCVGHVALGYSIIESIIKAVRKHSAQSKLIIGGPIVSVEYELMFNSLNPDFVVINEGEVTILELLDALERNKDLSKVKGIGYRDSLGNLKFTEKREPIKNLDSIPLPDFDGFDFEKKLDNTPTNSEFFLFDSPRTYPILGSRGCPFSCTFCYHENKYRTRSINKILEELNHAVKKYKINMVVLYDDCFSINRERLNEFCNGIKKLRKEISWDLRWTPQLTVHLINEELLKTMRDAGCVVISYGFESYNQKILDSMHKPITPKQIDNALKKTLATKIAIQANFIFGDIAETKETAEETLDYWKRNAKGQINLSIVDPYPGSKIYDYCIKKGVIKDKLYFIKNQMGHMFYTGLNITSMSDKDLNHLKAKIMSYKAKYYAIGKKPVLNKDILTITCPFCKKRIVYKNVKFNNKLLYDDLFLCRNCRMRFRARSFLKRLAYFIYPLIEPLNNRRLEINKFINISYLKR